MYRARFTGWIGAVVIAFATVACSQTDPGITTAVKGKLAADDTVKAYKIDVDTKDHVVTLSGNVDSAVAKARAVELARGTKGVRDVVDNTTIMAANEPSAADNAVATSGRAAKDADAKIDSAQNKAGEAADKAGDATSDAALTAKVKSKFLADTSISGLKIDVDTKNHVVTLSGTVPSAAERTRAVAVAKQTDGVKSVINKLKVGK